MLSNLLIFCGVALVIFLLVVLVVQASMARLILQEINGNNVMQQSNSHAKNENENAQQPLTMVRSYGMIADAGTSQSLSNAYGAPMRMSGFAVCQEKTTGNFSMQPVSYPQTCWLALTPTSNSNRFQKDVASGAISTIVIANVFARVWLATWPSSSSSSSAPTANGDLLFTISPVSSATAVDATNYTATVVVDPLLTSSSTQSSWGSLVISLMSGSGESTIPLHIWAF